jgi:cysteinyl-tRNA synthetase
VITKVASQKRILKLYNTASRSKEDLVQHGDHIGVYACGPTVYNYAHIGNLKTYIVEDVLRRSLGLMGYKLRHVMNITDVGHLTGDNDEGEDKMLKSAREQGRTVWDIAEHYTQAFFSDSEKLNIQLPDVVCKATDHISDMVNLVETLEEKGYAYQAGGNVYFDINRFEDYGKMAKLHLEDQQAGARVDVDDGKRSPYDFALWFTNSKFENQAMVWDSPWGSGYPGWHIECSAMSRKYLGDQFDIHCGGTDHIPVHHSNEIAQSEAASGKSPWVRFWFHSAFLLFNREKMSKSKGGFITLKSLEEMGYHPLDYRYFVLGANYRTQLNFSDESMDAAQTARGKLGERIAELPPWDERLAARADAVLDGEGNLSESGSAYWNAFLDALADDLNTPRALAEMWGLVKSDAIDKGEKRVLLHLMDQVFALDLDAIVPASDGDLEEEILALIEQRNSARKNRDFARADEIRDQLAERGIILVDTPEGTSWKKNL